ncbi:Inactive GDSL esterase/lipase-like protein 25 [Arabidopsis thaliana]|uniref:MVP1 n=2 Tax=Arabidopsis TaxID=3701 RepID=A0A178W8Q3_ARATH|nr:GDSL lipase/esterase [Arabidopsis thaliana x Arabidopsis arenosa]OAP14708.1 MVP1 [Arabidopsis thaliana]
MLLIPSFTANSNEPPPSKLSLSDLSMAILKSHFFLLFPLLLLHFLTVSFAQTLFVFGDGLYDAGNKQFLSQNRVDASFPPYGVTVGQATGRWSDGSIVPDYLAKFMGIPKISPILLTTADFSHGANFAIADATVLGSPPETMTLSQQVKKFSENKNKWTNQTRSEAIYLIYIGSDDYLSYAKSNPSPSDNQKQAFVDQVITTIKAEIKVVYGSGGRKFAFQNLAPLGCLPAVKQASGNVQECVKLPSEMAALHNKKLLQLLVELSRELNGFQYSFYDFFSSIQNRVIKSKTYTFETGNAACCGTGSINGSNCSAKNVCAKPEEYIFFDGKHLTQEANLQVGHLMWGADPEVIGPNNIRELMVLPLDITVILAGIQEAMAAMRPRQSNIESLYDIKKMESEMDNHWLYQVDKAISFMI